jgi:hypothetical protein
MTDKVCAVTSSENTDKNNVEGLLRSNAKGKSE